jgi:hypothetical protein
MPDKIGFSLNKITTEQFAIIESAFKDDFEILFNIVSKYGINEKDKMIATFIAPAFSKNEIPFLVLEIACHFKIAEDAWEKFTSKDKTKLNLPIGFIRHLTMLSIGTARGVLHSKTENTVFNKFVLPTINVNEIVKNGISFNLIND